MAKPKNTNAPEGATDSVTPSATDTPPSDPPGSDDVKEGAAFMVNWRLEGFRGQAFERGEVVEADPQEVASLVACGVLSPLAVETEA